MPDLFSFSKRKGFLSFSIFLIYFLYYKLFQERERKRETHVRKYLRNVSNSRNSYISFRSLYIKYCPIKSFFPGFTAGEENSRSTRRSNHIKRCLRFPRAIRQPVYPRRAEPPRIYLVASIVVVSSCGTGPINNSRNSAWNSLESRYGILPV